MAWASGYHTKRSFFFVDLLKHLRCSFDFEDARGTIALKDINSK